jgi:hypothetical protein
MLFIVFVVRFCNQIIHILKLIMKEKEEPLFELQLNRNASLGAVLKTINTSFSLNCNDCKTKLSTVARCAPAFVFTIITLYKNKLKLGT